MLPLFQINRRIQKNVDSSVVTSSDRSITMCGFHLASELNMLSYFVKAPSEGRTGSRLVYFSRYLIRITHPHQVRHPTKWFVRCVPPRSQ